MNVYNFLEDMKGGGSTDTSFNAMTHILYDMIHDEERSEDNVKGYLNRMNPYTEFKVGDQHDASEFLQKYLGEFQKAEGSKFNSLFGIEETIQVKCGNYSKDDEFKIISILKLPIGDATTPVAISQLLSDTQEKKDMKERKPEACDTETAYETITYIPQGDYVIIHLGIVGDTKTKREIPRIQPTNPTIRHQTFC